MKAWAESLDAGSRSGIRFLADAHAAFTKAADLAFDSTAIFGNERSKRYALVIEDGKVKEVHVEPDNTGVNGMFLVLTVDDQLLTSLLVSSAEKVLA